MKAIQLAILNRFDIWQWHCNISFVLEEINQA